MEIWGNTGEIVGTNLVYLQSKQRNGKVHSLIFLAILAFSSCPDIIGIEHSYKQETSNIAQGLADSGKLRFHS